MRSQVQVLAGPPPIIAGQSAVGSGLGVLTACLGRAGAARPSPPASPSALPGRPAPASGATTATQRSRLSSQDNSRAAGAATSRGRRPHTTRPAPPPTPLLTDARPRQHQVSSAVDRAARRRGRPPGAWTRSRREGCSAAPAWSPPSPPNVDETDARPDGRGGHRTAGRWTGGHQPVDAGSPGRRHQLTGHWTGWTPEGWTGGAGLRAGSWRTSGLRSCLVRVRTASRRDP
jgi:hypothetical protein